MTLPVPPRQPGEPDPKPPPRPAGDVRPKSTFAATLALSLLAFGVWAYFRSPSIQSLAAADVRSVDVRFEPWGADRVTAPGAESRDAEAIAALVAVLQQAEGTPDHKCGSRGAITLRMPPRHPVTLHFLPGHSPDWYEYRYAGRAYRVPRAAFVAAMKRVGVDVPLECQ